MRSSLVRNAIQALAVGLDLHLRQIQLSLDLKLLSHCCLIRQIFLLMQCYSCKDPHYGQCFVSYIGTPLLKDKSRNFTVVIW